MARICENGIYRDMKENEVPITPDAEEHTDDISKIKTELKEIKEMVFPLLRLIGKEEIIR